MAAASVPCHGSWRRGLAPWCAGAAALALTAAAGAACSSAPRGGSPSTAKEAGQALAARYLVIAVAGNRRLERDVNGYEGQDHADLARARADLVDEAATEREFDRRLLMIAFPTAIETTARGLARANEARAALTTTAAGVGSLSRLWAFEPQLRAANRSVEVQVKAIRQELGLPPPETS